MPLFAQAAEATRVAVDASNQLMTQWGVAGVLVLVIIASAGVLIWYFQGEIKNYRNETAIANKIAADVIREMKDSFIKALKEEREACDARHTLQLAADEKRHLALQASHEKEMQSHYDMMKEWRKEIISESRAMRDMVQLWVSKMAFKRAAEGDETEDAASGKQRAS